MRVLLTTDTVGGVWTFTKDLATELLGMGHSISLVSLGREPSLSQFAWAAELARQSDGAFRYQSSAAPLEWTSHNDTAYIQALPIILSCIEQFTPDVIHTSQFCFGSLPVTIPTVISAHSDVLSWAASCEMDALTPSAWISQYVSLVQNGLRSASAVVAPTQWMLNALRENFSFQAPGKVVLNGRTLPRQNNYAKPRRLQAVSVGRMWDKAKNLGLLAKVRTSLPILVAGDAAHEDQGVSAEPDRLKMLGYLDEDDLLDLFQESSFYIVASRYEPFGLAPLEGALCGCAVLAHDIASLREVWGSAALYFRNSEELSALMDHLSYSNDSLRRAQEMALARAKELTSLKMARSYVAIYQEAIDEYPSRETEHDQAKRSLLHNTSRELAVHAG